MSVGALQLFQVMRFSVLIIVGMFLVKAGYDLEQIGAYELFFFVANVVSFFWTMGLTNGLVSYYPSLEEARKKSLIFNLFLTLIVLGCIAGLFLYLLRGPLSVGLDTSVWLDGIGLIIAYMVLSAPGNLVETVYLLKGEPKKIKRYGFFIFGLQLCMMLLAITLKCSIQILLLLMLAWAAVKFLWMCMEVVKARYFKIDLKLAITFILFSLPLMFHILLGNGMEYVDGFLVNSFFDESAFAQFRYGARELPLVTVLIGAISTALIPIAVNDMDRALQDVKTRIKKMMNILFPVSICLMLISPIVFPLIYSEDYQISARIFNVYLLVISSRILMPQVVLFARHENVILMSSAFIELIVNVLLSLLLLQHFGIVGIAWATVIAYLVNKLILLAFAWKKHGIYPTQYLNIKLYSLWFSILLITYYISTFYH